MPTAPGSSARDATLFLSCFAGPDAGKRIPLRADYLLFGRAADCNLLSDDPDVADRHATLELVDGVLHLHALGSAPLFVDGRQSGDAIVGPGQQLRIGRSTWRIEGTTATEGFVAFVDRLGNRISTAAGVEQVHGVKAKEMFSDVAKRRGEDDVETYFGVGAPQTTPPLAAVDADWPKPWAFFRVFALSLALYTGFLGAWIEFANMNLIPGLIMVGSFAIPFSLVIFFFEMNVPRNVSLYRVLRVLVVGGLVSIVLSLFGFQWTGLDSWLGAMSAGIIEESGKTLALLLVVHKRRYRWTLNGLLFGASVGAGFAIFESAGYALNAALDNGAEAMRTIIVERGALSVLGGHTLWTGLVGAALWRVRGDRPFRLDMLIDPRFLRVLGLAMLMHMIWNSPLELPFYATDIALGFVAWVLVLGFIQDGLKQVREAQATAGAATPAGFISVLAATPDGSDSAPVTGAA